MNNNKKYKKWSLGLVAPALVLAPIAVVASCSSSTEEKEAYAIKFTETDQIKATIHKTVQPDQLKEDKFKEEVLEHKSDLFTIEGKLPSDSFLNDNIKITELNPNNGAKTVSAKVTVDKANTNGQPIDKTITLTGLGYEEVDLTTLTYKISFKDGLNEIALNGQSDVSVDAINADKLIGLILLDGNKTKILEIKDDANKITDEILANQILSIDGDLNKDANNGKIKFTLKVSNPENGKGDPLTKEITFTGFKSETDSTPPATQQFKIKFKDEAEELDGVSDRSVNDFSTGDDLKQIVIQNKDKIFETETGSLPGNDWWTEEKLTISTPVLDAANGSVTANISLDGYDTTDSAGQNNTLTKNDVVLKGFKKEAQTIIETKELSTVTLGLNGTVAEAATEVNAKWVLEHKRLLFTKGFNLIENEADIKEVSLTAKTPNTKAALKFKVVANKWFEADGVLGKTDKEFTVNTLGFTVANATGTLLKNKSGSGPLSIGLVDPALAEGTYEAFKNDSAKIFTKEFVFTYRKHLLSGDFSKIDAGTAEDFLKEYTTPSTTFVQVVPNDSDQTIQIKFTILGNKLVGSTANTEYTITFNQFKTS